MRHRFAQLLATEVGNEFQFEGYRFVRRATGSLREKNFELRSRVYEDEGYVEAGASASSILDDEFDHVAEHLVVLDAANNAVGATRFILPSAVGYPTERYFNIRRPEVAPESLGEYSRLTLAKVHRGGSRAVMIGLLKLVYEVMVENGVTNVYSFMAPNLVESLAALGCVTHRLPESPPTQRHLQNRSHMRGYFENSEVTPRLLRLEEAVAAVTAR